MIPKADGVLKGLGLEPDTFSQAVLLSQRHGHAVWRVSSHQRSRILKWLPAGKARIEISTYQLLRSLGVATLPLYASSEEAILIEDLDHSPTWRLVQESDVSRAEVGRAVARWYRQFHAAGAELVSKTGAPAFLKREADELTPESIRATGRALGLGHHPLWEQAAGMINQIKSALESMSLTLNYNDFYWTNLALSRQEGTDPQAIVFDYHLLGIGMRYSDCRNVTFSLAGAAVDAFWQEYGYCDPREVLLDRPLAALYDLHMAAREPRPPAWAQESIQEVRSGQLSQDLLAAQALAAAMTVPPENRTG